MKKALAWQECKRCQRKIVQVEGRPALLEGFCSQCYQVVTGKCAECRGTGAIQRAHLGTLECPACEGSGKAKQ